MNGPGKYKKYINNIEREDHFVYVGKGNAVPLHARSGPEGSRNLRDPDYVTTAQGWW